VAGCRQKQKHEKKKSFESQLLMAGQKYRGYTRQYSREEQRMGEASMSTEVAVVNTEPKANYVCIWKNRAQRASKPNTSWNLGAVEASSNTQGSYPMR
jgi:hypothetical protein